MQIKPAPYYNNPQIAIKLNSVPYKMGIMGRGLGKTTIFADQIVKCITYMPRGKVLFGGKTYFHIKNKSFPVIRDHWERLGLYRNIHYFLGTKAPKKWKWDEPYQAPVDYSNCIHFWNGLVVEFASFDRPEMVRSGSYDFLMLDEITGLKKKAIDEDIWPTNRGNKDRFGHIRFHHGILFLGTMPITAAGDWVFDYEKLMEEFPVDYLYLEASARENIHILGERYFRDLKRILPPAIYDLEVENKRRKRNINGFYPLLNEDRHGYSDSYNYSFYDNLDHDLDKGSLDCRGDKDHLKDEPIYLSFDFGSTQNCCIVAQWYKSINQFPIINNFYIENDTLSVLVQKFIDYYQYHSPDHKVVYLYGGSEGNKKNDARSRQTYFDDIKIQLKKSGWTSIDRSQLYEASHMDKFQFWNKYLSGDFTNIPAFRINMNNAKETFFSMDNAPIIQDEFRKDKSSERRSDQPRWKATDLSDAVDNLYYWILSPMMDEILPTFDMFILKGNN